MNEAEKILVEWFEWSGNPWIDNDYGDTLCFFCYEDKPDHTEDCFFVKAKRLVDSIKERYKS